MTKREEYEKETGVTPCIITCDSAISYTEWLEKKVKDLEAALDMIILYAQHR